MRKQLEMRRYEFASRTEQRRYEAWLAKVACQPVPTYFHPHVVRHAIDPDGVVSVLYYSIAPEQSPTCRVWRVP